MGRKIGHSGSQPRNKKKAKLRSLLGGSEWGVYEPPNKDSLKIARIYVNYGIESGVSLDGELIRLSNRRHLPVVAGDLVYTDGRTVEGILPRGKVLVRYADEGGVRMIASHLDQVGVVISASTPPFHEGFVDRYLVYCRIVDLPLFIVANKMDEPEPDFLERVEPFVAAGVDVYPTSATTEEGLKALSKRLSRGITLLSGFSGVGKSTLINSILGEEIPTQEVSPSTKRGRHTTTAAEAYELGDTLLIDSPGIKKFGFIGISAAQILRGFPELAPYADKCRFEDCRHVDEKGCAVVEAVDEGLVDERRYISYVELLESNVE